MNRLLVTFGFLIAFALCVAQERPLPLPTGWKMRQIPGTNVVLPLPGELEKQKDGKAGQNFEYESANLTVHVEVSQPDPKTSISRTVIEIIGKSVLDSFQSAQGKTVTVLDSKATEVNHNPAYRVSLDITEGSTQLRLRLSILGDESRLVIVSVVRKSPDFEVDALRIVNGIDVAKSGQHN